MPTIPAKPFILVDGSSYLFRAYHALPPLTTSKGQPTGAIYGVVNMLRKLMKDYQPEKMAVVFDSKEKNFRHALYEPYKANRTVMPDELQSQIESLYSLIQAMGLPLIILPGIEADDIIGTLAKRATAQGIFTLISTGDKDFAQLVDDHIFLINTMSQDIFDRARVIEKFEVPPEQIIDYLALIGDSVDNIPGIPNVGPKTAVKWLKTYGSFDNIIAAASEISGKVGDNLRNTLDKLPLFRDLVTINVNMELPLEASEFILQPPDNQKLKTLFTDLEFKTWLKDLDSKVSPQGLESDRGSDKTDKVIIRREAHENFGNGGNLDNSENSDNSEKNREQSKTQFEIISDNQQLQKLMQRLSESSIFSLVIKTNSSNQINPWLSNIVGLGFSLGENEAFYISPRQENLHDHKEDIESTLNLLKPILENKNIAKVGYNLKFEIEVLANHGIQLKGPLYDVMVESYVLDSTAKHDLINLAKRVLNKDITSFEDIAGKGAKQLEFADIELDKSSAFIAESADVIFQLHLSLWNQLNQNLSLKTVFETIEMPLVSVLAMMEMTGVSVDEKMLHKQSQELESRLAKLEKEAFELAGDSFNINSPKQLQEILFQRLKLPMLEKTPTGQPSTSESVLQTLAEKYPLPKVILEYRSLSKLKSTYTDKLPEQIDPKTQRIHTSYHQAITSTGRLSSSDPNLQNIPIRTEEGRKIRCAFIAKPGYKIVAADYSQIELRIMAHLSQDAAMLRGFSIDDDIHRSTAAEVFSVSLQEVTQEQRRNAKVINFGLIYGMSSFGLSRQLGLDRAESEKRISAYFASFPGIKLFIDKTLIDAREKGYVETIFGRRLYLPDIKSGNVIRRKAVERAAVNAPMQGSNADIIKLAMIELDQYCKPLQNKVRMIMQVHDELVFEVAEDILDETVLKIKNVMENVVSLSVPLRVDVGIGKSWEEAHKI